MKITNKLNLPLPIYEAIVNDSYSAGQSDITATSLIDPPRLQALKEKHKHEIEEDASDRIYSLQGQSIHTILERAAKSLESQGYIAERRFYSEFNGWKLGAQIDIFHQPSGLLQDYKVTSVYSVKDGIKEEYAKQMNIQAELLRRNGFTVRKLQIVAILRDWSKGELQRSRQSEHPYPENQVVVLDVPLIPSEEVVEYINERVDAHKAARAGTLPRCTKEERWAKDDVWAVMKKGQKRAVKLFFNEITSEDVIAAYGAGHYVEFRQGESTRCKSYCPAARFCDQYKGEKK